jgi:hypothetical protein
MLLTHTDTEEEEMKEVTGIVMATTVTLTVEARMRT